MAKRVEAVRAWACDDGGKLVGFANPWKEQLPFTPGAFDAVRVRIIREADYRRLLAAAKRKRK